MDTLLLIVVAALMLYIAYLEFKLMVNPPQTVVVMPSTANQESGLGCAAVILLILVGVIALALLGLLPPLG